MNAVNIGKQIEERRKAMGLSQKALAEKLGNGSSQSHVSAMERGINLPSVTLLGELAEVLGTDPNTLIGWGGEEVGVVAIDTVAATAVAANATPVFVVSEAA